MHFYRSLTTASYNRLPSIRSFTTGKTLRQSAEKPPSLSGPSSSSTMPYVAGAIGGATAVCLAGYAIYHFSGAKDMVRKVANAKERYNETKVAVNEKRDVVRDNASALAQTAKEQVREKTTNLREKWNMSRSRGKSQEDD